MDDRALIRSVADRLEALADRTTGGDWRSAGLLASRPEVVAHGADGGTEHVAEARARTAAWITALSPAVAGPLVTLLRVAGGADPLEPAAVDLARELAARLP
ncbi:hypothetical protein GCM10010531_09790 [Blastococcus jejuensis]|uniref:Uncharacterized protein n=1 Tax=Blastococcus jejuensis TaxID=351224 RepID=A0ABP6NWW6_9ACTN